MSSAEIKHEVPLTIERRGNKLVVPENLSWEDIMKWVKRAANEDEKAVQILELIETYPLDGALALTKALSKKFGWADMVPTPGFWRDEPPAMIGVEVELNRTIQVPWGRIQMPGVEGYIETSVALKDGRSILQISGVVKNKHKGVVAEIAALTREFIRDESIYRGKAIRVRFPEPRKPGQRPMPEDFDPTQHAPRFMDLRGVSEGDLILPIETFRQVQTNLYNPVERTAEARKYRIPLKRGVLLAGPYGVGKTMVANITASKCVQNNWTFIYLESAKHLQQAISFALQYQPACIFAEDVDQIIGTDARDEQTNMLLNTIDGIEIKGQEVMVVLTSNHVEKLNPAMLRPGRLDAIITIPPPDADAAARLVRNYGRNLIPKEEDLSRVGEILAGQKPATIREVVERSKLAAIGRLSPNEGLTLHAQDLETAAEGMVSHIKLMDRKPEEPPTALQQLGKELGREVGEAQTKTMVSLAEKFLTSKNGSHGREVPSAS